MNRSPVTILKCYASTARVSFVLLACLGLGACGTARKISSYETAVTNVTVVYATTRDKDSHTGPYRTQSDNNHFLEI